LVQLWGSDNVADELNAYFTTPAPSTGLPDTSHISYRPLIQGDSFSFFCFDEMCLAVSIWNFTSNTTGLDGIPFVFIKLLLPVLTQLFNFILASSIFPLVWKIFFAVLVSKLESPMKKLDYHPISILPVLANYIENVMFEKMADYVTRNNLISPFKSGF
jgi:hypothetical protein